MASINDEKAIIIAVPIRSERSEHVQIERSQQYQTRRVTILMDRRDVFNFNYR